jgi:prolyl-tRNA synthetase
MFMQCIPMYFLYRHLIMGCYGIGVTRLMAATVEILTPRESNDIRWPRRIVPYQVAILPPKVRLVELISKYHLNSRKVARKNQMVMKKRLVVY